MSSIPRPDVALKDFFKDNKIFAALFNGFFFNSQEIFKAEELEQIDTAYSETVSTYYGYEPIKKYRDNIRCTSLGNIVIIAIEDQDKIHYSMPVRKMMYDALGYSAELANKTKTEEKTGWTVDERLSRVKNGTKITPIITVVFYTGENAWDGPRSLYDMMDLDDTIKPFVPDYPLYVIDIGHDEDITFENEELKDLQFALSAIYNKTADASSMEVKNSILSLAGILANDPVLYRNAKESKGEKTAMCKAMEERDAVIFADIRAKLAEKDTELAEKDAEMAVKIAEKDTEIEHLKALISAAGITVE